jgi:CheY-like chemotaxis protein
MDTRSAEYFERMRNSEPFPSSPKPVGAKHQDKASAAAAAFDYHLVKPIRFDELAKVLQETEAAADILGTAI